MKIDTLEKNSIRHTGEVVAVAHNKVKVRIDSAADCGSCPASALCKGVGSDTANELTIPVAGASSFNINDKVEIIGSERLHRRAIWLCTFLPCLAVIAVMVAVYLVSFNELWAALAGMFTVAIFCLLLYIFRNKIEREFSFNINHLHTNKL
jgi:positive regulator of sigma E activity